MATLSKSKLFDSPKLDSRIKSANTKASEIWLGYFGGPMLLYMAYYTGWPAPAILGEIAQAKLGLLLLCAAKYPRNAITIWIVWRTLEPLFTTFKYKRRHISEHSIAVYANDHNRTSNV